MTDTSDFAYRKSGVEILFGSACELLPQIPDRSVDLVITDPPYGVGGREMNGIPYKDEFYNVDFTAGELYRALKADSRAFVFTAQKTYYRVAAAFVSAGFKLHQTLVWHRPNLVGGTRKKTYEFTNVHENIFVFHKGHPAKLSKVDGAHNTDVLKYAMPQSNFRDKRMHIHQKPLALLEHLVLAASEDGDLILDPFAGVGTTGVAAARHGRRAILIEIQEEYVKRAIGRLEGHV